MAEIPHEVAEAEVKRSSRSPEDLGVGFERWLAHRLGPEAAPTVRSASSTGGSGLSSETVVVEACWQGDAGLVEARLVLRLAPDAADVPVFPSYRLDRQARLLADVAASSTVPVPRVRFFEDDPTWLGSPFFAMDHVEGRVPADLPPYVFPGSWLAEATDAERCALEEAVVDLLVELHAIPDAARRFGYLVDGEPGLAAHMADRQAWYRFAARDTGSCELIEDCFGWLVEHWPAEESGPVLSWGDARIGNILFDRTKPAAVLDWEMASVGPRELDVAWCLYAHALFQYTAAAVGMEGLPDLLRPDRVRERYEARSGTTLRHMGWYELYSATQFGIVGLRTSLRGLRFSGQPMPDQVEELLFNRAQLEELLAAARAGRSAD